MKTSLKLLAGVLLGLMATPVFASSTYQWNLGSYGTFQLPTTASDAMPLAGYDFIQRQSIVGVAADFLVLFKEIHGYGGVVGEFNSPSPNAQPYAALGADMKKYIPGLNQITDLQIHGFGRYVSSTSNNNHLGAGLAMAYKF